MSDEEGFVDRLLQESEVAREKYRSSGFGLMTTIITLSSGGVALVIKEQAVVQNPRSAIRVLCVPIILALLQQLAAYFAQRGAYKSKSQQAVHEIIKELRRTNVVARAQDKIEASSSNALEGARRKAERMARFSDGLCVVTCLAFICILAYGTFWF